MQSYKRHLMFYRGARKLLAPLIKWIFHIEVQPAPEIAGPFIAVSNHVTDLDPLFMGLSFPGHMYFVASEHIFRSPFIGGLLKYFLDPISKQKGGADVGTAMQMLRRIKKGMNVGLFAEGNKSFHGGPCPIVPATGSLVKASGASLCTYRLEGGYFTNPRWSHSLRRGRMKGYPVNVYPPEVLSNMTGEEINKLIARDIGEDAYLRQEEDPISYRGKRLAEGLQNALYLCPGCLGRGTLIGEGDFIRCGCGFEARLLDTGYFEGGPFKTVAAWGDWQKEKLQRIIGNLGDETVFSDEGQEILMILPGHRVRSLTLGKMTIGRRGLDCGELHWSFQDILGLDVYGRNNIVFSDITGGHYQVRSQTERSGLKYQDAWEILREEMKQRD
jgi:1-acyl-sn-glycerol-3-phosphate acyltransferase